MNQISTFITAVIALGLIIERTLQCIFNVYQAIEPTFIEKIPTGVLQIYTNYKVLVKETISIPIGIGLGFALIFIGTQVYTVQSLSIGERCAVAITSGVLAPYMHQIIQLAGNLQKAVPGLGRTVA